MGGRGHINSFAYTQVRHHAIGGSVGTHPLTRLAGLGNGINFRRRHPERHQPLARRGQQGPAAPLGCSQILALGVYQRWGVDLEQNLALRHRIAGGLYAQGFDPAFHPGVDVAHGVLVVLDVADGLDAPLQHAALRRRGAQAQVLHHRRADANHCLVFRFFFVFGVHGHQRHAHRRFAGLVAAIVGIHRRHPVQDFPFGIFAGGTGRIGGFRRQQEASNADANGQGTDGRQRRQQNAATGLHSAAPVK